MKNDMSAWQEYCKTLAPNIQGCCRATAVASGVNALVKNIAEALPEWSFHYRLERGGWYRPGGAIDADGKPLASNLEQWAESALARHDDDMAALVEELAQTPCYATRLSGKTHYFVAQAGEAPEDFLQLEIEELQEVKAHRLGASDHDIPSTLSELIDPIAPPPARQEAIKLPAYNFRRLLHVGATLRRMAVNAPDAPILRFIADWNSSSAGLACVFHKQWLIALREYLDIYQQTQYRAQPIAILSGKPSAFELEQGGSGLNLHAALQTFDREAGYPFAWFFHLLSTKAVPHWVAQTVVEDALNGFAYLPQRDVDVVRNWLHRPYTP
ncbi:MAG: hypothetical protein LBQ81_04415 [Zoogloeaceae bacterium]|nr:hypothetical protein [Zoogloeaceae bacterium]